MAKKISDRAVLGDRGIALIHDRVLEMGFLWHQRGGLEAGIDGEIELRDPVTEEVLNRVILVQSKASGHFDGEDEDSFHYYCGAADRDYWLQSNVPVLLICSHPETGQAWWVCIQDWFSSPERLESTRIDFDKRGDRFDRDAAGRLLELGGTGASRGYMPALSKTETLLSNLLPIERIPTRIYAAPTSCRRTYEAWERMEEKESRASDFIIKDKHIYSFRDLDSSPLSVLCDGRITSFEASEWSGTGDRDLMNRFVQLLGATLRESFHRDLRWHPERHYLYVRATSDLRSRKFRSGSGKRTTTVFSPYLTKKDPRKVAYYRHSAFQRRFVRYGELWYMEILPTYHYTYDGARESHYAAEYLRKIKQRERNQAVASQVKMWARYLRGEETLLRRDLDLLGFGSLVSFEVNAGINDEAWRKPEEVASLPDHPRLFEAA